MIREFLEAIGVYYIYNRWLKETIDNGEKPKHIGVIMDGNRRWARKRDLIPWEGHWEGADKVEEFLEWCLELGINPSFIAAFSISSILGSLIAFSRGTRLPSLRLYLISKYAGQIRSFPLPLNETTLVEYSCRSAAIGFTLRKQQR